MGRAKTLAMWFAPVGTADPAVRGNDVAAQQERHACVVRVSAALCMGGFVSTLMGWGATEGITHARRASQQGGVGLILTTLIVMTPPMAAASLNGVMDQLYVSICAEMQR